MQARFELPHLSIQLYDLKRFPEFGIGSFRCCNSQILRNGTAEKFGLLCQVAECVTSFFGTADENAAVLGLQQPRDKRKDCSLAASASPCEGDAFAFRDAQRETFEDRSAISTAPVGYVLYE